MRRFTPPQLLFAQGANGSIFGWAIDVAVHNDFDHHVPARILNSRDHPPRSAFSPLSGFRPVALGSTCNALIGGTVGVGFGRTSMGTWGTAVFADDDAADVRDSFSHYLADTQDLPRATNAIAQDFGATLDTPEAHTAFWLGLALTQWRNGWLDPRVRDAALAIITSGADLAKWHANDVRKRAKALETLSRQLSSQPRSAKPMPAPWPVQLADFQIGEIVALPLQSGRLAVMKVVTFRRTISLRVRGPAVALQKWTSRTMPTATECKALQPLAWPIAPNGLQTFGNLVLTGPRTKPIDASSFLRPGIVEAVLVNEPRRSYTCVSTWPPYSLNDIVEAGIGRWWEDPTLPADAFAPWHVAKRGARST